MKSRILSAAVIFAFLYFPDAGMVAGVILPRIEGKETVATVNGESITLEELKRQVLSLHGEREGEEPISNENASGLLDRMIDLVLIIQEGRNIGLDELPDVEKPARAYEIRTLHEMLFERRVRDVKALESEIEKIYRDMVKELNVRSVVVK